jgi:hypothetical protein
MGKGKVVKIVLIILMAPVLLPSYPGKEKRNDFHSYAKCFINFYRI